MDSRVEELEGFIETEQVKIDEVNEEKFGYEKEYRKLEAEVGPIKYIAEFIYGEQADTNLLEAAVRWVIIIIIFVFDPLAVLLLIASQYTFNWHRENKGGGSPGKPNQDPDPEPEPPYTDKEWNEAHRLNHEFDRAKKIAENVPPTLSKKNTDQYLIWPDVDPDNNVQPQEQTLHEMAMEGFRQEQQDYAQEELDFEAPAENNVEQWNDWVEAANKAAEESPEDDDDDAEFWESLTSEEQEAMRLWKAEDERNSLKYQRKLFRNGQIEQYPWIKYLQPQPDHTDESNFKIMPALEKELKIGKPVYTEVVEEQKELKKKKEYLNWIEKEGKTQVKKSKEIEN